MTKTKFFDRTIMQKFYNLSQWEKDLKEAENKIKNSKIKLRKFMKSLKKHKKQYEIINNILLEIEEIQNNSYIEIIEKNLLKINLKDEEFKFF